MAGIATFPGSLPAARQVGTLAQGSSALVLFTLAFLAVALVLLAVRYRAGGQVLRQQVK